MGRAVGERLLEAGFAVTVWNRSPGRADEVAAAGATVATSIGEAVTSAEVVITFLADDGALRAVGMGDDGVLGHLGERWWIDMSTVSAELSRQLAARCERFGSMPVLGRPDALRSGQATLLLGAGRSVQERIEPIVKTLSPKVLRFEEPPLAAAAKLATNSLLLAGVTALAEAFAIGRAGGLDTAQLRALFDGSPVVAAALGNRFDAVLEGDGDAWWTVELGHKDASLALGLGESADVSLPLVTAVRDRFDQARSAGLADEDIAAVTRLYGKAGVFDMTDR
jgi:3-hydroxyisobutyrate dehydrogenase-like beta-hydroxyacid dehydrogenase